MKESITYLGVKTLDRLLARLSEDFKLGQPIINRDFSIRVEYVSGFQYEKEDIIFYNKTIYIVIDSYLGDENMTPDKVPQCIPYREIDSLEDFSNINIMLFHGCIDWDISSILCGQYQWSPIMSAYKNKFKLMKKIRHDN
jgi:hypothetical protein